MGDNIDDLLVLYYIYAVGYKPDDWIIKKSMWIMRLKNYTKSFG